ncbi:MAG: TIGR04282 family arsenosugar biosynthesis glycosyltransferase [Flavobacteriales bacterium]|nr:TIGR04282 family arsenosugar biosynthesis glycosyltransferase [Flavobacteriales bacterium]
MSKTLLIVFVKNIRLGKVKTRLAKTIGTEGAFHVYKHLVEITENVANQISSDKRVYFSDVIIDEKWQKTAKFIQKGGDLGEKMQNSFKKGQKDGFDKIVLIGSDLPDVSSEIIQQGFDELNNNEVVFGPAEDGGYYLVGMTKPHFSIFKNKQWSTETLLKETTNELKEKGVSFSLLKTLNDVDTIEDLKGSSIAGKFEGLIKSTL